MIPLASPPGALRTTLRLAGSTPAMSIMPSTSTPLLNCLSSRPLTGRPPRRVPRSGKQCRCCSGETPDTPAPATPNLSWQSNAERYQPPLSKVEKNELRAESQRLGKGLCRLQIGIAGITRNTVVALGDALSKNQLVKVRSHRAPALTLHHNLASGSHSRPLDACKHKLARLGAFYLCLARISQLVVAP